MLIAAGSLVDGTGDAGPGWLTVDGDKITGVGSGPLPGRPDHDFSAYTVTPGFIDIHVHGGGGRSFDEKAPRAADAVVAAHRAHGTTTMVASLVTAPIDELVASMQALRPLVERGLLAGIHLEGPFLSNEFRGAHPIRHLRAPDPPSLARLLEEGRGILSMVTLAPELDGAISAVRSIRAAGVIAAVGHTGATYEQTVAAIDAGATVATHLCNGMRLCHHRSPGPVAACLEDGRVAVELIADDIHLHPAALSLLARTAGPHRVLLVSDAIAAAASGDGLCTLGGHRVEVSAGRAVLAGTHTLAGSTLTLDVALARAVASGVGLCAAVAALTANPARILGLTDRGELSVGRRADLVVLSERLEVRAVVVAGRLQARRT